MRCLQTRYLSGILGGLALGIVEIGGDGNDRFVDLVAQVSFRGFLEFPQDHRGDFRRRVLSRVDLDLDVLFRSAGDLVRNELLFGGHFIVSAAHEPLD